MLLQIVQGESFYAQLQWCDNLGQPRDIDGLSPSAVLIDVRGNEAMRFEDNLLDAANGLYEIKQVDTSALPVGHYYLVVSYQNNTLTTNMLPLSVQVVPQRTQPPFRHYKIGAYSGFTKLLLRDNTEQASVTAFASDWSTQETNNG